MFVIKTGKNYYGPFIDAIQWREKKLGGSAVMVVKSEKREEDLAPSHLPAQWAEMRYYILEDGRVLREGTDGNLVLQG